MLNLSNFTMNMGEYAFFIWASYTVWFITLAGMVLHCYISYRKYKDEVIKLMEIRLQKDKVSHDNG